MSRNPEAPFAPVADALPDDGTVSHGGGTVTLDGSGSDAGPWGTNVTYGWALTAPTSGVTVRFDDDASATTLVTIEALAADIELTFTLTVTGRGGTDGITPDTDAATVTVTRVAAAGICGRTPVVRDRILGKISGVSNCALVTDARLADITGMLNLKGQNIAALAAGDFAGLTSLSVLNLQNNDLTTLADGGFDGLAALETLNLTNNDLTTLADGGFDGLTALETLNLQNNDLTTLADGGFDGLAALETLNLTNNDLTTLADGGFDGLTALETLNLQNNDLTTLADGVFDGLAGLETLNLNNNDLTTLPDGVFDGLAALETLNLRYNQLQSLPDGVFEPLTALTGLTGLDLRNNRSAPFAPTADAQPDDGTVSSAGGRVPLDGSGSDGGPWGMNVTYGWALTDPTSGVTVRFDDDASVTPEARIPALAADTELTFTLTVTGRGGEDERGVAPAADTAKVTVVTVLPDPTAGVCGRTPAVRDALIDRLSVTSCGAVSDAKLASITDLSLSGQEFTALAAGDFAGLTSLATLRLTNTALTALPGGVFDGLNALTNLVVNGTNTLTALSPGAFAGLTALTYLWLDNNGLENLPDGVFSGLTSLTDLRLDFNGLTALSPGDFAGLSSLKTLRLENNELATLPDDVFEPLTALTDLRLLDNDGAPFSPEAVALPDDGTVPVAGGMVPLDGSGSGGAWGTNVTYGWALTDPASEVTVTFDNDASPTPEVTIPALTAGTALTFTLTVTGRGGTSGIDPATDIAKVTSTASDDATLSGLTVNHGTGDLTLDPTFAPGTFAYAAEVDKAVTTVTLTAMKTDDGASVSGVTLNGNAIADSDFTNGITVPSLLVGDNDIVVTVTAENGASQTYTVTVTRTNSAPTASDGSVTTDEDTAHTFAAVEFNFVDSDGGDALASVTVVTLPAAGGLALDGTAVTLDQAVPAAKIGDLVFTPEANANGMGYASFTFKVSDGTEESALDYMMTVNVTAVNDPATGMPTISGTARVGETLTAVTTGIADADGPASPTYGYQWIRVDADGTSNATDVVGETADTYIPVEADDGKKLRVKVSFTDDDSTEEELTSDAFPSSGTIEVSADICGRTGVVRRALLALISSVSNCADVTATHLAAIGTLDLSPITALAAGDFAGLTSLIALRLNNNSLTTLPDGVFAGLTALRTLRLDDNRLTTLPDGVFAGLTALRTLRLEDNFLATLPDGVFAGLTALRMLTLQRIRLTTLPAGVFDGLTELTTLGLYENLLTRLPAGVFDGLTELTTLYLYDNRLTTLPAGVFDGLTALEALNLSDNFLTTLPAGVFAELTALTGLSLTGNDGAPFAPKAVALPDDGTVPNAGGTVPLDGSRSGGAWGTNVTYGWALTTPASGATFNDNTSPTPEVTIEALAAGTELTFTLTVTGRGGTDGIVPATDPATVTATGPPASDDATLSGLTVNDGTSDLTLDPTFASAKTSYAAEVANAVTTVTLTAMTTDDGASVSAVILNGNAIADSDFTDGITVPSLLVGDNAIIVTVTAEDTSSTQTYTVTVAREADANAAPLFTSPSAFDAAENQTAVGTVTATDSDDSVTDYTIEGGADQSTFSIVAATGALTFTAAPNFEAPTDADRGNDYVVVVRATSGTGERKKTADQPITVTVTDVAGEAPGVPDAPTVVPATSVTSVTVTWTAPSNEGPPITSYDLQYRVGNSGDFTTWTEDVTGTSATITGLAENTEYEVQVQATNAEGTGGWSASGSGTTDANAAPLFTSPSAFDAAENQTAVGMVTATDSDDSVTDYTIKPGEDGSTFSIVAATGALTFTAAPNFEAPTDADRGNDYVVVVRATSGTGERKKTADQPITVTVTDVAGEAPGVPDAPTVVPATSVTSVTVTWTAPSNEGPPITSYDLQYRVGNSGDFTTWTEDVTGTSATITGLAENTEYEVQVQATNAEGTGGWSASGSGTTDANAAPLFTSPSAFDAAENQTAVGTVTATDSDDSVTDYTIEAGEDGSTFSIVAATGALTFTAAPNFEAPTDADRGNDYVVVVRATSGTGERKKTADQPITVTVTDVAGEAPGVPDAPTVVPATSVTSVTVTWTAPSNEGPPITSYDLQYRVGNSGDFTTWTEDVTGTSATITGLAENTEYEVQVQATNAEGTGGWSASGSGTTDANAAPLFTSPSAFDAAENQTAVGMVTATDSDDSVTDYTIKPGEDGSTFSIVAATGALTFTAAPNFEAPTDADRGNDYVVVVRATSGTGERKKTADQPITVTVTDVAGEAPGVPDAPTVVPATSVTSVTVTWTAPSNEGPPITSYDLQYRVGNSGDFTTWTEDVTGTSATITGLAENTEYEVQVQATNAEGTGGWSASGSGTTDANAAPLFTSPSAFDAAENQTAVGMVTATDSDDSVTDYTIKPGEDGSTFSIVAATGALTFTAAPNFEAPTDADRGNDYVVVVRATSGTGERKKTADQPITVTVTDVAGEAPGVPDAPTVVPATSVTSVTVTWTAPSNEGPPITSYDLQYRVGNSGDFTTWTEDVTGTSATITGLAENTEYEVQVQATNAEGTGGWSASGSGTTDAERGAAVHLAVGVRRGGEPDRGGDGHGDGQRRQRDGLHDQARRGRVDVLHRGRDRSADVHGGAELRGPDGRRPGQRLRGGGAGDQRHGRAEEDRGPADHGDGDGRGRRGAGRAGRADGGAGDFGDECDGDLDRALERGAADHELRPAVPRRQQRGLHHLDGGRDRDERDDHGARGEHGVRGAGAGHQRRGHGRLVRVGERHDGRERGAAVHLAVGVRRGGEPDRGGDGHGDGQRRQRDGLHDQARRGRVDVLHRGRDRSADVHGGAELRGPDGRRPGQRLRGGGAGDQRHGRAEEDRGPADHGDGDGRGRRGAGRAGRADGGAGDFGDECDGDLDRALERGAADHELRPAVPRRQQRGLHHLDGGRDRDERDDHGARGEHGVRGAGAGHQRRGHGAAGPRRGAARRTRTRRRCSPRRRRSTRRRTRPRWGWSRRRTATTA